MTYITVGQVSRVLTQTEMNDNDRKWSDCDLKWCVCFPGKVLVFGVGSGLLNLCEHGKCLRRNAVILMTWNVKMNDDNFTSDHHVGLMNSSCWNRSNAVPQHTYGGAGERGGTAPTHSRLRHGGKWSASRTGHSLPPVPTGHEAGRASEPVWTKTLQEKSFASAGDRTSIARFSSL
jgi:hypothetical protein